MHFDPRAITDIFSDRNISDSFQKIAAVIPHESMLDLTLPNQKLIPEKSFAYVVKLASGEIVKKFPIVNPASAFISHWYLTKQASSIPRREFTRILNNINGALAAFNVDISRGGYEHNKIAEEIINSAETLEITDAPQDFTALILDGYMEGEEGVIGAIERYKAYSRELDAKEAFDVAVKIVDRAEELGVHIPKESDLMRIRQMDTSKLNVKMAGIIIKSRIVEYKTEGLRKSAIALINSIDKMPAQEVVSAVYGMDKTAGIAGKYGRSVMSPFSMYGARKVMEKTASQPLSDKTRTEMKKIFSESFVEGFEKKAAEIGVYAAIKESSGPQLRKMLRDILGVK